MKPLMMMRTKGITGPAFAKHACSQRLSKSVGNFIGMDEEGEIPPPPEGVCLTLEGSAYGLVTPPLNVSDSFVMGFKVRITPENLNAYVVFSDDESPSEGPDRFTFSQINGGQEMFMHINSVAHSWTPPFPVRDGLFHNYKVSGVGGTLTFEQDGIDSPSIPVNPAPSKFTHFGTRGDTLSARMRGQVRDVYIQADGDRTDWPMDEPSDTVLPSDPAGRPINLLGVTIGDWHDCEQEAPAYIILDGLFYGLCNVYWTCPSNWVVGGGVAISDGTQGGDSDLRQDFRIFAGRQYEVTFTVDAVSAGSVKVVLIDSGHGQDRDSVGTFTETITAEGANASRPIFVRADPDFIGQISNLQVHEV